MTLHILRVAVRKIFPSLMLQTGYDQGSKESRRDGR
ncbi:unnamed protein product [Callosobruchus maculatus]|uniref:Uncharacterized protein n=1 Tax=Callosobruchus maculatus TaxID=64391 RepID=A0A653BUD6_CALMS|nr:unnamed protein product [Callosobruchus maculatus]